MEARNRTIAEWHGKIQRGEIKLPRFQRYEAWDRYRICSLIETVIHNLPLGITLVLEVGRNDEKFISRFLRTAPNDGELVLEHLLDGQQRLTALWRMFHNNYDSETYFIYLKEFDEYPWDDEREDKTAYFRGRYIKNNGRRYPLWCDDPAQCLERGFIPTHLLRPEVIQQEIDDWIEAATKKKHPTDDINALEEFFHFKKSVSDRIKDLRSIVANYNLPYLSLPAQTDKSVALDVFIKMNTNSKPLSQYDIIVAEVEGVMGSSLHDLQDELAREFPAIERYSDLSDLVLTTSALLQDALPNQRGAWDMDKRVMVENWNGMVRCLNQMAGFLEGEGVFDRQRLPTSAVLPVIAALYSNIPNGGDKRGHDEILLKKYLWRSFFTDRYENSAATRAYTDYMAMKRLIVGGRNPDGTEPTLSDAPIFSEFDLVEIEELLSADWPKRSTIRGRAILAVTSRLGAQDFSTGQSLTTENIANRHYHHIYPDALLKEAGIDSFLALNCALISDTTNISIGRKDPVDYLADRYEWTSETIVRERLTSHLIPIAELAHGGYEGLTEENKREKLERDFPRFIQKRAELVMSAANVLVEGRQFNKDDLAL